MNKHEKALLEAFRQLPDADRQSLKDFADFLVARLPEPETVETQPLDIPRPDDETVIAAVKRLSKTYPMINKDNLLNETSSLVAANLMQGRDKIEVIDELEALFEAEYNKLQHTES